MIQGTSAPTFDPWRRVGAARVPGIGDAEATPAPPDAKQQDTIQREDAPDVLEPGAERIVHLVARQVHEGAGQPGHELFEAQPRRERPLRPAALLDEPGRGT